MESIERFGAQRHDVAIAEQDNFRAAIDWATATDPELAVRIALSLENFWVTNDPHEGVRRFDAFLARSDELSPEVRAAAYRCRGNAHAIQGDRAAGMEDYEAARACYREVGNDVGVLLMEHRLLVNRDVASLDERLSEFEGLLGRFRELGLVTGEVQVLGSLAEIERRLGNVARAADLLETSAARAESIGFDWTERGTRASLASLFLEERRLDDARAQARRALELARRTGDRMGVVASLALFARLASEVGDREEAGVFWGAIEAEASRKPLGSWAVERRAEIESLLPLADGAFARGRERRLSLEDAVELALAGA
jgi:tetratricopeptide (TPR) repeat protein